MLENVQMQICESLSSVAHYYNLYITLHSLPPTLLSLYVQNVLVKNQLMPQPFLLTSECSKPSFHPWT